MLPHSHLVFGAVAALVAGAVSSPVSHGTTASVNLKISSEENVWLVPVEVGESELYLRLVANRGDFYVLSDLTPKNITEGRAFYDTSSGTELDGVTWQAGDVQGESLLSGPVYTDKVTAGLSVASQAVEVVEHVNTIVQLESSSGVFGLGLSRTNINGPKQKTFYENIQSKLAAPLFTTALKDDSGILDFGFIDPSKFKGKIIFTTVPLPDTWAFASTAYSVGSVTTERKLVTQVTPDAAFSFLPEDVIKAYYAQVEGAVFNDAYDLWLVPCDAKLPDLGLTVKGLDLKIYGRFLIGAPIGSQRSATCFGELQSVELVKDEGVGELLGAAFFKSMFVVFEKGTGPARLGLAQQA